MSKVKAAANEPSRDLLSPISFRRSEPNLIMKSSRPKLSKFIKKLRKRSDPSASSNRGSSGSFPVKHEETKSRRRSQAGVRTKQDANSGSSHSRRSSRSTHTDSTSRSHSRANSSSHSRSNPSPHSYSNSSSHSRSHSNSSSHSSSSSRSPSQSSSRSLSQSSVDSKSRGSSNSGSRSPEERRKTTVNKERREKSTSSSHSRRPHHKESKERGEQTPRPEPVSASWEPSMPPPPPPPPRKVRGKKQMKQDNHFPEVKEKPLPERIGIPQDDDESSPSDILQDFDVLTPILEDDEFSEARKEIPSYSHERDELVYEMKQASSKPEPQVSTHRRALKPKTLTIEDVMNVIESARKGDFTRVQMNQQNSMKRGPPLFVRDEDQQTVEEESRDEEIRSNKVTQHDASAHSRTGEDASQSFHRQAVSTSVKALAAPQPCEEEPSEESIAPPDERHSVLPSAAKSGSRHSRRREASSRLSQRDQNTDATVKVTMDEIEKVVSMLESGTSADEFSQSPCPSSIRSMRTSSSPKNSARSQRSTVVEEIELNCIDKIMKMCTERETSTHSTQIDHREPPSESDNSHSAPRVVSLLGEVEKPNSAPKSDKDSHKQEHDNATSYTPLALTVSSDSDDAELIARLQEDEHRMEESQDETGQFDQEEDCRDPSPCMAALSAAQTASEESGEDWKVHNGSIDSMYEPSLGSSRSSFMVNIQVQERFDQTFIEPVSSLRLDAIGASDEERLERDPSPYHYGQVEEEEAFESFHFSNHGSSRDEEDGAQFEDADRDVEEEITFEKEIPFDTAPFNNMKFGVEEGFRANTAPPDDRDTSVKEETGFRAALFEDPNFDVQESRLRFEVNRDVEDSRSRHESFTFKKNFHDEETRDDCNDINCRSEETADTTVDDALSEEDSDDDSSDDSSTDYDFRYDDEFETDNEYDSECASYNANTEAKTTIKKTTIKKTTKKETTVVVPAFKSAFASRANPTGIVTAASSASDSWVQDELSNLHPIARMRLKNQSKREEECYHYY